LHTILHTTFCRTEKTQEYNRTVKQALALLLVIFSARCSGFAQQQHQQKPIPGGHKADLGVAQGKPLSVAEVHDIARRVAVLIAERQPNGDTRHVGSGVWLAEGLVATCWHVVRDLKGPIKISLGAGDVVTYGGSVFEGTFQDYAAQVVASDPTADVAILKTAENPFKSKNVLIDTPTGQINPKLSVARMSGNAPSAGTSTVLSGYPLQGSDLVSQSGNVAGTGVLHANQFADDRGEPTKKVRLLVSVVSNPGNSGGPVLNDHGELIGILEGNLESPARDETGRQAIYIRPKRDAAGNFLKDANGNPQFEQAGMLENSGISLVVPTHLITPLLKQAESIK
jgi:S1-C subfamily serine protease